MLIGPQVKAFFYNSGQNYSALIGRWFAKVVVSATMASRFAEVDENGIQDLMVSGKNENTRKRTIYWLNVFHKWAAPREVKQRLEEYEYQAIDKTLCKEEFRP